MSILSENREIHAKRGRKATGHGKQTNRAKNNEFTGPSYRSPDKLIQAAIHNSKGYSQAVMSVSSFGKSSSQSAAYVDYMSQQDTAELKTKDGKNLSGLEAKELIKLWTKETKKRKGSNRITMHMVLSSDVGSNPEKVEESVKNFLNDQFKDNEVIYVMHTDKPNPHAHVSIKMQNSQGKKIAANKPDLYIWRENYADKLRGQGFNMTATSRQSRGEIGKSLRVSSSLKFNSVGKTLNPPAERKNDKKNINEWISNYENIAELLNNSDNEELKKTGKKIIGYSQKLQRDLKSSTRQNHQPSESLLSSEKMQSAEIDR